MEDTAFPFPRAYASPIYINCNGTLIGSNAVQHTGRFHSITDSLQLLCVSRGLRSRYRKRAVHKLATSLNLILTITSNRGRITALILGYAEGVVSTFRTAFSTSRTVAVMELSSFVSPAQIKSRPQHPYLC